LIGWSEGCSSGASGDFDASGLPRNNADEAASFAFDNHAVDAGRADTEEPLHVGFGGRLTVDQRVRIYV